MADFRYDFSSTAYLALDRHPQFRDWVEAGFARYGVHYGGSRYAPGAPGIYAEAEALLADWLDAEAALLVSSGSLAAAWVRGSLGSRGWDLQFATTVHPAWSPDLPVAERPARLQASLATGGAIALFADSIDPIAVAQPDPGRLLATPPAGAFCWVLDDSHAIGLLGADGRGLAPGYRAVLPGTVLAVGSLGKALSLPAGYVAGPRELVEALRASPRYGGAAPPNPAFIHAFLQAPQLIRQQREALHARLDYFRRHVPTAFPLRTISGHPALRCMAPGFHAFAQREGIRLSHFAYPSARDEPVTRIVLNAGLTFPQIDTLLGGIERFTNA